MRFLSLILVLFSIGSDAATICIKSGVVGSNNTGSDWNNAITNWTGASGTWVRGNTYYFAGGDYRQAAYARLDAAVSGTTFTTIKYATVADHGPATGWQDSFASIPAQFRNWSVDTSYWIINGQVGQGATNIAYPAYVPYGFVFHGTNMLDSGYMIRAGASGNPITNIYYSHIENYDDNIPRTSNPPWYQSYEAFNQEGGGSNVVYQYCWCHNMSSVGIDVTAINSLVDHCIVEQNGEGQIAMNWVPSDHSELMTIHPGASVTIRNSVFRDWRSTGGLVFWVTTGTNAVYGNIFSQTGYWTPAESGDGTGVLVLLNSETGPWTNYYCFNNTFALMKYGGMAFNQEPATNLFEENNIVFEATNSVTGQFSFGPRAGSANAITDYNWYYLSGSQSETHIQNGTGDPFINSASGDFRLAANTTAGDSTVFANFDTTDPSGNARTTVSRGAFEFTASTDPLITSQPQNQTVNLGQTATFTVTATGTATIFYYWYKNGSLIQAGTQNSYTTSPTTCAYNGNSVFVTVSNSVSQVTSSTATLTVNGCQGTVTNYVSQIGTANIGAARF